MQTAAEIKWTGLKQIVFRACNIEAKHNLQREFALQDGNEHGQQTACAGSGLGRCPGQHSTREPVRNIVVSLISGCRNHRHDHHHHLPSNRTVREGAFAPRQHGLQQV